MAILVDLNELYSLQPAISGVEQGSGNSASIGNVIREFKASASGSILKGEIWKTEGQKLDIYITATEKSQSIGDKLVATLNSTISAIEGAWDSRFGASIKDTYRDEIASNLIVAEANLATCEAYLKSLPDNSPHLESARRAVAEAQALVNELRDLLAAIDKFLAVYNSEMSKLDNVISELEANFGNYVNQIIATDAWIFNPDGGIQVNNAPVPPSTVPISSPLDFELHGETNIDMIADYLTNVKGYNPAVVAGLVASIYDSSGGDANTIGDNGYSYGIIQWNKERWDDFNTYCETNNYDGSDLGTQLYYLTEVYMDDHCLDPSMIAYDYENASDCFSQEEDTEAKAKEVAKYATINFMRPENIGAAKDRRAYMASEIYKLMQNNPDMTYGEAVQIVNDKIKANARAY